MNNLYSKILIVIMFGIFSIFLGIIIGLISHKIVVHNQTPPKIITQDSTAVSVVVDSTLKTDDKADSRTKQYELHLFLGIDKIVTQENKELLELAGYDCEIQSTSKANKNLYILKLKGSFAHSTAVSLGEEIKKIFPTFGGYWLVEVQKPEVAREFTDKDSTENLNDISAEDPSGISVDKPRTGPFFELQILANTDRIKVEQRKNTLENAGYRVKIITARINNKQYFRLRLQDKYTWEEGSRIGEELKQKFDWIDNYWLEKIIK